MAENNIFLEHLTNQVTSHAICDLCRFIFVQNTHKTYLKDNSSKTDTKPTL